MQDRQVRTGTTIGIGLALVLLVGSTTLGAAPGPTGSPSPQPSPTVGPMPTAVPATRLAGHWTKIPKAPWGAVSPATVVVDGDMLVMDRHSGRVLLYDPESRTWERRARVPDRVRTIGPSVWTGDEFVVFNKLHSGRIVAYDPATDTWRTLPRSPLRGHDFAVFADGRIVVAHVEQDSEIDISRDLAMFDLADGTWSALPPPVGLGRLVDLVWTGSALLAVTLDEFRDEVQVASLELASGVWSEPLTGPLGWYWADPVWTGDRLVFAGGESFGGRSDASFDPATMTWTAEDFDCPVYTRAAVWTGELLVGTNSPYALDPTTGDCYRLPGPDRTVGGSAAAVWTGDRVIYWSGGGAEEGDPNPFRRGGHAFVFDSATTDEGG